MALRVCLTLLLLFSIAAAPVLAWDPPVDPKRWRVIVQTDAFALSYDPWRVDPKGRSIFTGWTRLDFREPQGIGEGEERVEYTHSTQIEEFDCARRRSRTSVRYLLDRDGKEVASDKTRQEWQEVVEGSVGERFFTTFCAEVQRRRGGQ